MEIFRQVLEVFAAVPAWVPLILCPALTVASAVAFAVFGGRGLLTGAPLIIFTLCCSTSRTRAHHSTLPRGNGGMAIPYYILGRRRDFQIRSYQELTTYNS